MTAPLSGTDEYITALLDRCAELHDEIDALQQSNADLLAACEALFPMAEAGIPALLESSHPEERDGHHDAWLAKLDIARAAIAKARGQS